MTLKEQIKAIMANVQPHFDTLGLYMFQGEGEIEEVTQSFASVYEAYLRAKEVTQQTLGTKDIELKADSMFCSPDGGIVQNDDDEMQAAYDLIKRKGELPPSFLDDLSVYGMQIAQYFVAAQQQS